LQIGAALIAVAFGTSALSRDEESEGRAVLIELFTSQSCSSCPPAEALLRDLARRANVVALEWHVDYWDDLNVGASGRWKDAFSAPAHTARQRAYNMAIRGTMAVYTPQIIVSGVAETTGSNLPAIEKLLSQARAAPPQAIIGREGDAFIVRKAPPGAEAMLVTFQRAAQTRVRGGENAGDRLAEVNVVVEMKPMGSAYNGARFKAPALDADLNCALLVIAPETGAAAGATYCGPYSPQIGE
jgi:hypothetical protein